MYDVGIIQPEPGIISGNRQLFSYLVNVKTGIFMVVDTARSHQLPQEISRYKTFVRNRAFIKSEGYVTGKRYQLAGICPEGSFVIGFLSQQAGDNDHAVYSRSVHIFHKTGLVFHGLPKSSGGYYRHSSVHFLYNEGYRA
ncbi:hypothetical protein FQZ97_854950 [compost metagenome]